MRSQLSKLKFAMGYCPKIEKRRDAASFLPPNFQAVVTITADFELAWAPRYNNTVANPLQFALKLARRERSNVPKILHVCEQFNIPITWATVGHLFLKSCKGNEHKKHAEIPKVPAYKGRYWDFDGKDWFEYDPCTGLREDPEWYAPDLIEAFIESEVDHEIGCHTFSHIDCREEVCPTELFQSEVSLCQQLASERGLRLTSFVHPGHTIGHLDTLTQLGFTSFQSDPGNILGYPIRHSNGIWELQRTMEFAYRSGWSDDYQAYRLMKTVDRALATQAVCNFWFHPSFPTAMVEKVLPNLMAHIQDRRNEIWMGTVGKYVDYLNSISCKK